jgi:FG-GAP-like repeat
MRSPRSVPMHSRSLFVALALAVFALPAAAQPCKRGFSAPDRIITAQGVDSVYGDFDEDGRTDVAFTTSGYAFAVSLNRGRGVFEPAGTQSYLSLTSSLRLRGVIDLDHDGHLDLFFWGQQTAWARGRGDGTFEPAAPLPLSDQDLLDARVLDFDRDGFPDIVAWSRYAVLLLRSAENGTLVWTKNPPLSGPLFESVTVGDFDGDGNVDMAYVPYNLPGKTGIATFLWSATTPAAGTTTEQFPFDPTSPFEPVDLDGDGRQELVGTADGVLVVMHLANRVLTHESFPFPRNVPAEGSRRPVATDLDGDGRTDLAFSHGRSLAVARGLEGGGFAAPVSVGVGGARDFALADIDGDGLQDVVTTRSDDGAYVLYAGRTVVEPPAQRLFGLAGPVRQLELADVDGDGLQDVVAAAGALTSTAISVLLNDGAGFFRLASTLQFDFSKTIVVADFDGDGQADLAVGTYDQSFAHPIVTFGDGTGAFAGEIELPLAGLRGSLRTSSAAAGKELLVVQDGEVRSLRVTRAGEVTAASLGPYLQNASVVAFDLNGDGIDEIARGTALGIEIAERTGSAWTAIHRLASSVTTFGTIAVTDLDGDRVDDLVLPTDGDAVVYIRNGSSFDPPRHLNSWGYAGGVAVTDVDGDRHPDLVLGTGRSYGEPGLLEVFRNDGLGAFTPYNNAITGPPSGGFLVLDADGDGAAEILRGVFDGVELHRTVCVTPRVRVTAVPRRVVPGDRVKLVIHELSTDWFAYGWVAIRQNGALVAEQGPQNPAEYATTTWTSEPLPAGRYVFTIDYSDHYAGPSSTTLTIDVRDDPPRRRSMRH